MTGFAGAVWHPLTQHGLGVPEILIDRAQGAYLHTVDGRQIFDAIASWWVVTHGHCHPHIVKAVQRQAERLGQIIFAGLTHDPAEQLAQHLLRLAGAQHEFVFYSDSGSTAVEVAIKMAVGYWAHNGQARHKVLALQGGYHGDTFGAMSTSGRSVFSQAYEKMLFETVHIPVLVPGREDESLSALETILKTQISEIAAFVFEPLVQGAAGMVMYAPEMLRAMCDLCRRYGVLLIADEVMTGFGRTGSFFACDQAGVKADLVALSKGLTGGFLPMGVTLATREIYNAFYGSDRGTMFMHSTSFTANPLACAAAIASFEVWRDTDVQGQVDEIAASHCDAVKRFSAMDHISNARSMGTIFAMDVIDKNGGGYLSDFAPRFMAEALRRDILLRPIGHTIYILPPYCASAQDLQKAYDAIEEILPLLL